MPGRSAGMCVAGAVALSGNPNFKSTADVACADRCVSGTKCLHGRDLLREGLIFTLRRLNILRYGYK